ncbi:kinase-like domain-containing protein [Rhexocercosporidium sp. MPI-PUGE-AT-0058]|nr:kinase-like domain-containing protein [Rhexocercosporidium sp. MPI-PUGE-AT-0058]
MNRDYSRPNRDYNHPEKYYKGLPHRDLPPPNGLPMPTKEQLSTLVGVKAYADTPEELQTELCRACGWKVLDEFSSYDPRVKIFHTRANVGMWALGSEWILIDQKNNPDTLGNDFMTQDFLRNQSDCKIPLVKEMKCISKPTDKIKFTLMSRAEGVTLQSIWHTLTTDQRLSYTDQVADVIRELRNYTSPVACKVDGTPLDDIILGVCSERAPCCKKIGFTGKEWIENLAEELRDGLARTYKTNDHAIIEEKFQELKDNFPEQGPYVLTHGDLNTTNIIVKDGKIEAIIDWELAGYYPWWVERYRFGGNDATAELFAPLWSRIGGEMDQEAFNQGIGPMVSIFHYFQRCHFEHPNHNGVWLRPAFCDCRQYGGLIKMETLGQPTGHRLLKRGYDPKKNTNLPIVDNPEDPEDPEEKAWLKRELLKFCLHYLEGEEPETENPVQ